MEEDFNLDSLLEEVESAVSPHADRRKSEGVTKKREFGFFLSHYQATGGDQVGMRE